MHAQQPFVTKDIMDHVIDEMANAISQRPDEGPQHKAVRARVATAMLEDLGPRDAAQVMLAGHCVMFHAVLIDSFRETLRGEMDTMRRGTRSNLVAMNKSFHINLDRLDQYQTRAAKTANGPAIVETIQAAPPMTPEPDAPPAATPTAVAAPDATVTSAPAAPVASAPISLRSPRLRPPRSPSRRSPRSPRLRSPRSHPFRSPCSPPRRSARSHSLAPPWPHSLPPPRSHRLRATRRISHGRRSASPTLGLGTHRRCRPPAIPRMRGQAPQTRAIARCPPHRNPRLPRKRRPLLHQNEQADRMRRVVRRAMIGRSWRARPPG